MDSVVYSQSVFEGLPWCHVLLSTDPTILAATESYFAATKTNPDNHIGNYLFDIFPENPNTASNSIAKDLSFSLQEMLRMYKRQTISLQRYNLPTPDGVFETLWWRIINTPILVKNGVIITVEDVTNMMERLESAGYARICYIAEYSLFIRIPGPY
jgi:hypothetical protein